MCACDRDECQVSLTYSTIVLEAESLNKPGAQRFHYFVWLVSAKDSPALSSTVSPLLDAFFISHLGLHCTVWEHWADEASFATPDLYQVLLR